MVILSFPRIELLILSGFVDAFRDACESLVGSRINNLVKVLDHGVFESQPYAVLQNITYESLESKFRRGADSAQQPTLDSVLDWAAPLAVCLDELHEAGFIHSNVRPSSVHIGSQQVLLGDFITELSLQRMSKFKGAISTLNVDSYLAPEYLKSNYTASYDQYLLATLLYQALANKPPFDEAKSGEEYRMHVATQVAEQLSNVRSDLSLVSEVLDTALQRNPLKRFSSCRELISRLQETQAQKPPVVTLKPAQQELPMRDVEKVTKQSVITPTRNKADANREGGLKGLVLLGGGILLSVAAVYIVMNHNNADQVMSNPSKIKGINEVLEEQVSESNQLPQKIQAVEVSNADKVDQGSVEVAASKEVDSKQVNVVELSNLIEQEALLAQSETTQTAEDLTQIIQEKMKQAEVSGSESIEDVQSQSAEDKDAFLALTAAISSSVNAAQKEFIESQNQSESESVTESESQAPIDIAAITNEVSAAVSDSPDLNAQALDDERLNQELLAAEALVREKEAIAAQALAREKEVTAAQALAKEREAKKAEEAAAEEERSTTTAEERGQPVVIQASQEEEADKDTTGPEVANNSNQVVVTERERIRAFKEKELARIKAVTNDCVIGSKVHREAASGNLAFVKACMAVGVDPNLTNGNRWTLLHIAARSGHLNMSKLLVAKGGRVNEKSSNGLTALDMATAQRQTKVINYLKARGGVTTR